MLVEISPTQVLNHGTWGGHVVNLLVTHLAARLLHIYPRPGTTLHLPTSKYSNLSLYYDTLRRKKYHYIRTIKISSINF